MNDKFGEYSSLRNISLSFIQDKMENGLRHASEVVLLNLSHPLHKLAVFKSKNELTKTALAAKVANFVSNGFWFWLEERTIHFAKDVQKFF